MCLLSCLVCRKLENWEDAATDAEIAQEIDPSNVKVAGLRDNHFMSFHDMMSIVSSKAYYNRAMALQLGGSADEALLFLFLQCLQALKICKKGLQVQENKALQQLKSDLERSIKEACH